MDRCRYLDLYHENNFPGTCPSRHAYCRATANPRCGHLHGLEPQRLGGRFAPAGRPVRQFKQRQHHRLCHDRDDQTVHPTSQHLETGDHRWHHGARLFRIPGGLHRFQRAPGALFCLWSRGFRPQIPFIGQGRERGHYYPSLENHRAGKLHRPAPQWGCQRQSRGWRADPRPIRRQPHRQFQSRGGHILREHLGRQSIQRSTGQRVAGVAELWHELRTVSDLRFIRQRRTALRRPDHRRRHELQSPIYRRRQEHDLHERLWS